MPAAKIRSLYIRPLESADLSFNTAGIIDYRNNKTRLGQPVQAFDLQQIVNGLLVTLPSNSARLQFEPSEIRKSLGDQVLFSLRSDSLDAALLQAIVQREITFLQKYKHTSKIVTALKEIYPDKPTPHDKLTRLDELRRSSDERRDQLTKAYKSTKGFESVVPDSKTNTSITGSSVVATRTTPVSFRQEAYSIRVTGDGGANYHNVDPFRTVPQALASGGPTDGQWVDIGGPISFDSQISKTENDVKQASSTVTQEFKHPIMETILRDGRLQVDLQDEVLSNKIYSFRVPDMQSILENELKVIDLEILKAQIRYLQTFLTSPISGIITTIYKDQGESVQPGEAVLRVENNTELLLVGLVNYRHGITTQRQVHISTKNIFGSNDPLTMGGEIVSVRGHDSDDDEWDIVVQAKNVEVDKSGAMLPINFHFDRDNTVFEISD